jgi:diaminohydroxyphosphoribosylaminopyrimidine deaminase / 5-amino-6-(5-phosphoribosylamino)uracil reductase
MPMIPVADKSRMRGFRITYLSSSQLVKSNESVLKKDRNVIAKMVARIKFRLSLICPYPFQMTCMNEIRDVNIHGRRTFTMKKETTEHEHWMKLALDLARKGEGLTRPNPPVGAVVVKNGRLIGAGFHRRAGGDHAEIIALKKAGQKSHNASLYVTLEPCCTFGKTPPCVKAIIESGIRSVIVGAIDPNPRHKGHGLKYLRKAGIKVVAGVCQPETQELIAPFKQWIASGRPYVALKMGLSLDGKIADHTGQSRWITGKQSRLLVQDMRRRADAILIGAGTVLADDPGLLPKPALGRKTYRIIIDARGRVPPDSRLLRDAQANRTIMATTRQCPRQKRLAWGKHGAQVWLLPAHKNGVSIPALMNKIGQMGLLRVLCEGGAETAAALIRAGMVDEFSFFLAPRLIGGHNAPSAIGGHGWKLIDAPRLRFIECRNIGADVLIRAKPVKENVK